MHKVGDSRQKRSCFYKFNAVIHKMPTDELKFDISEKPFWRSGNTTSSLLKEIVSWKEKYEALSDEDKASFGGSFNVCMSIEYVHHSNVMGRVGTQTYDATKDALERILGLGGQVGANREERETVNTGKAFIALRMLHQQMGSTGKLTVEKICDIHRQLMTDLRSDAGILRTTDAHIRLPDNSFLFFAKPDVSRAKLASIVQTHNLYMDIFAAQKGSWSSQEQLVFLIKCAALLLYHILDVHPFSDGNGRVGWLMANYILSLLNPFPTHLYEMTKGKRDCQSDFGEAVANCRKSPKDGPRDIAAMLLDGIWVAWSKFFKALDTRKTASNLAFVCIQKSKIGEVEERVREVGLASIVNLSEAEVVSRVKEMVERVSVSGFSSQQYSQLRFDTLASSNISIFVRVFP